MLKLPGTRSFSPIISLRVHVIIDDDFGIYHQPHTARHDRRFFQRICLSWKVSHNSQLCAQSAVVRWNQIENGARDVMWCDEHCVWKLKMSWVKLYVEEKSRNFLRSLLDSFIWKIFPTFVGLDYSNVVLMHFHDFSFAPSLCLSPCGAGNKVSPLISDEMIHVSLEVPRQRCAHTMGRFRKFGECSCASYTYFISSSTF